MALIPCPGPGCDEKVIDIWLSCPKCRCPIQVLLKAGLGAGPGPGGGEGPGEARPEEDSGEKEHQQELEMARRLRERMQDVADEPEEEEGLETADLSQLEGGEPLELNQRLVLVGKGTMGAGGGFLLGIPLLLGNPPMVSFFVLAAVVLIASGFLIQSLAGKPDSGPR